MTMRRPVHHHPDPLRAAIVVLTFFAAWCIAVAVLNATVLHL